MDTERFNIVKILGKGRTGGTYEAIDRVSNQRVALKRFFSPQGETQPEQWQDTLVQLVQNIATIKHPAVMDIYDCGIDEDGPFMSMEFLQDALSIEKLIDVQRKERYLSDENFYVMANNLLDAFSGIHQQGFCHGSVSGRSVMEVPLGIGRKLYKCVDLGMSTITPMLNPSVSLLECSDIALAAPELFEGEEPNARTDVYMLGQLFYMSLAGGHPFAGLPKDEAYRRHAGHKMAPLSGYRSSVPKDIVDWIELLTQAAPDDRPRTAGEALSLMPVHEFADPPTRALAVDQEQVSKPPQTGVMIQTFGAAQGIKTAPSTALPRKVKKKKDSTGAVCVFLFLLISGVVGFFIYDNIQKNKSREAEVRKEEKENKKIEEKESKKLTDKQKEFIKAQMKRIKYDKVHPLLAKSQIDEGASLAEQLSFKSASGVWYLSAEGEDKLGGKLTIEKLIIPPVANFELVEASGATLKVEDSQSSNGYGFKMEPGAEFPKKVRFVVGDLESTILCARLIARVENLDITRSVMVSNKVPEGHSEQIMNYEDGLVAIDLLISSPRETERFALDFEIKDLTKNEEPGLFVPLALAVFDTKFPPLPETALKEDVETDVEVEVPEESSDEATEDVQEEEIPKAIVVDPVEDQP